jgi:hypothetical protein
VHRKYIPIYIQQNATLHNLFISGNCSTCFGWHFHPSSGVHATVSTASVICHTVTAICRYRGRVGTGLSVLWVAWQIPDAEVTVACTPDDGWKCLPKHVEQFPDINKLCNVASCWMHEYIGILLGVHPILHISRIRVKAVQSTEIVSGCQFIYLSDRLCGSARVSMRAPLDEFTWILILGVFYKSLSRKPKFC